MISDLEHLHLHRLVTLDVAPLDVAMRRLPEAGTTAAPQDSGEAKEV